MLVLYFQNGNFSRDETDVVEVGVLLEEGMKSVEDLFLSLF